MLKFSRYRAQLIDRLRRLTFAEGLLIALLLSSINNGKKASDIDSSLRSIDSSLTDVQNEVRSQSEDLQSKIDELKSALDQIAADQ